MSAQTGDHPSFDGKFGPRVGRILRGIVEASFPQDWVGFVRQSIMQRSGAPSYLFGEIRDTGWRYYYLVALAVKVPLAFWLVVAARAAMSRRIPSGGPRLGPSRGGGRLRGDRFHRFHPKPGNPLLAAGSRLWRSSGSPGWPKGIDGRDAWPTPASPPRPWLPRRSIPTSCLISTSWRAARSAAVTSCPTRTSTGVRASSRWRGSSANTLSSAT